MSLINSRMTNQNTHNTHRPNAPRLFMAQKCSMPQGMRHLAYSQNNVSTYKKSVLVLYYSGAVDPTILTPLSAIVVE